MTEKELVAKMLDTLVRSRKELANIDLGITKKSLPDLDKIIEHISAPLMIMVMGEFSTGKSTFINAMVGEEVAAMNATPTTAVITKLCYGAKDKILVHFTDGTEKEYKKTAFKRLTSKTGKKNEDKTHESIEYVERQLPLDMLQYVTIIDSPGLNDINEKHSDTTKKFVNNADTVFWMFNALHAGSKTEVNAMETLTPRLKPIAIINMMDEIDEEEDDPQEFLNNLRVQLKDKVQAVVGISAKYALEGKLENNEVKNEIGNLKELEQVVRELVLPNRDKFKLNTLMDELGEWFVGIASDLDDATNSTIKLKESDYGKYIDDKAKLQQNKEILLNITEVIKDYCIGESKKYNEQAMYFIGGLYYYGISYEKDFDKAEFYWESAALKNHTLSQIMLGSLYSEKGDYQKEFFWHNKLAEAGSVVHQYLVGMHYLEGTGVEPNNTQGFYWLSKAAKQGNVYAQTALGICYSKGYGVNKNNQQAVYWYTEAAKRGNAGAQSQLGSCYIDGSGVKQDYKQAVYWYRKAAEQGDRHAQNNLGVCYYDGLGVEQDYKQAVYWYTKAAVQGDSYTQGYVGDCYYKGEGVELDYEQAVYWYRKAAEQGNVEAQYKLGNCCLTGQGVIKNEEEAYIWFKKAAEQGNAEAQYKLGNCYLTGQGITKNEEEAHLWFKKAVEQGNETAKKKLNEIEDLKRRKISDTEFKLATDYQNSGNTLLAIEHYEKAASLGSAEAQLNLGRMYFYGKGVKIDKRKAGEWYRKAAENGNAQAQFNLGVMYECGESDSGVNKDYLEAEKWYKKAVAQGHKDAPAFLYGIQKEIKKQKDAKDILAKLVREAENGNAEAQYELGNYYNNGIYVKRDDTKAIIWYRKSAEQGLKISQFNMGCFYENGWGTTADKEKALYWYKKAAEQGDEDAQKRINALQKSGEGDANAQYELGRYYAYNEKRVEKNSFQDWMTAFKCFKKAAEQGHVQAQFELAKCYDIGFGVTSDMQQALFWYRKAAENGHTDAIKRLSEISNRNSKKSINKKKSGCFITTAVCNSSNKIDDCYELQMFRRFRDNWLLKQIDGEKLIAEYYRIAPSIVNEIDKCPDSKIIYNNIWNYYLRKCLTMIENNENEKCKQLYIMMVQSLKQKYYND